MIAFRVNVRLTGAGSVSRTSFSLSPTRFVMLSKFFLAAVFLASRACSFSCNSRSMALSETVSHTEARQHPTLLLPLEYRSVACLQLLKTFVCLLAALLGFGIDCLRFRVLLEGQDELQQLNLRNSVSS